ncbi:MAG: M48 family metalloprotease [Parvibaculaceae bacterium]
MKESNDAARDLWAQIFERAAALPNAALHEPDEKAEAAQSEVVVQALREAGWSETEIERRNKSDSLHGDLESVNSPGVGPGLELRLQVLADRVRKVISEAGSTSHEKIEIGIDPKSGVSASLTNVIMTDQGILSVSAFLFRWCGLVARAYTRTLLADLTHWTSKASDPASDRELLLKNPDIVLYWFRIFVSFAGTGTHIIVPYRPATPAEFHLFEQVAWAMEYFTVAHEFGHHVLGHRNIGDDAKEQEFEADAFAAKVCERLEYEPFSALTNPYTRTGAGGSLMLLALEILRSFEDPNNSELNETHPAAKERISRISVRNLIQPKQLKMDQEFNGTVLRVMSAVFLVLNEFKDVGGGKLVAEIRQNLLQAEEQITHCKDS